VLEVVLFVVLQGFACALRWEGTMATNALLRSEYLRHLYVVSLNSAIDAIVEKQQREELETGNALWHIKYDVMRS